MSKRWWQTLASFALAINAAVLLAILYFGLSYGSNLRKLQNVGDTCFAVLSEYDSIRAAQLIGRLDLVSFLLTAGGILIALFAFMGFWMIRREALDEAANVAANEAQKVAQRYFKKGAPSPEGDKTGEESYMSKTASLSVEDVSTQGAVEESGEEKS